MHARIVAVALASLLLVGSAAMAQTPEIQKKVEKKLGELRKEKSGLEDLLTLALKNNADIRVAESKVRDAEVELYRTRMQTLGKVAMLYHEIGAAKAAADEALARYQRDKAAYDRAGLSAVELSASAAAAQKFKSDLARVEAQMEFLTGRNNQKDAVDKGVVWLLSRQIAAPNQPAPEDVPPSSIPEATAAKILKALDAPYDSGPDEMVVTAGELLQILSQRSKGINILDKVKNVDDEARLRFKESIPLGALFQWAEDQLNWRFIIRDYGIVAVERSSVPPGAVLLLDFWRNAKEGAAQ